MKKKKSTIKKIISMLTVVALLITCLPMYTNAAGTDVNRIADPSTMDDWKNYFGSTHLSTENAGGVWTDKSVFTDAASFGGTGISMNDEDGFLVALSAIASNMVVTGMSYTPTDTILILDVSGSMNDNQGNNDVAEELVEAANESIASLLSMNKYNRVGVVLYSGTSSSSTNNDAAMLVLPLGRYTTGSDGEYINYTVTSRQGSTTEKVSLDSNVVYEGTTRKPASSSKEVVGATYIQKGIILAKDQFTASGNSVTVEDSVLGTLSRTPVMVLMSDGAPTLATTSFTNPGQYNLGDGKSSSTSAALGFVTQLSAAYAKQQVEEKYKTDCLFYTLGLGVSGDSIATSVLNPAGSSTAINTFWSRYHAASVGSKVTVEGNNYNAKTVTKISQSLEQNCVEEYFAADGTSGSLADELKDAFADIVGKIQLQSKYFPTLISDNEDVSGYVSFVDKIGEHMEVTDIKGVLINNTLFSGADMASNFVEGGGTLGTYDNPTDLGNELVWAVQYRLGMDSADAARTLIGLAYQYGQLSYTSDEEYSNYIGWYANAAGKFLGFYQEGITVLPEATGDVATDPAFTIKSYGYLGEVNEEQGVAKSDMMYATVQVRESIATGEQTVAFAVPAALIPIVTYNVTLDEDSQLADLTVSGATDPIRLVYEVALKEEINEFTLKDVVSEDYLNKNTNGDGSVSFYTNQYELDNTTGYGTVNAYSYFNPSRQNEQYYYLKDTKVYADTNGTVYAGSSLPSGDRYHGSVVYKKDGSKLTTETKYSKIAADVLATAKKSEEDGSWYIPQGSVHVYISDYIVNKTTNETGTLTYSNIPFVDTHNHEVGDTGYYFYVGATLGNNGRLTIVPETGIKLTKEMVGTSASTDEPFTFVLTNLTDQKDADVYPAYRVGADETVANTSIAFTGGKATVTLTPGEILYIGGMTPGETIVVEEQETVDYVVQSVNGDASLDKATIHLIPNTISQVAFVNANRGKGNLTVAKEVEHDFGTSYQIPADLTFEMTVTLEGIGTQNATFTATQTGSDITSVTTDANGQFTVNLKDGEQVTLYNLPEGTKATVAESAPGTGFTAVYWENGIQEINDSYAEVEVVNQTTAYVLVVNDYTPEKVFPVNLKVEGTKYFKNEDGTDVADWGEYEFTVVLQRHESDGWKTVEEVSVDNENRRFAFDLSQQAYTVPGVYSYQIFEKEGDYEGVFYDNVWHTFSVKVSDEDMDGSLEIVSVYSEHTDKEFEQIDGVWEVDVSFTNIQYVTAPALAIIDVQKILTNLSESPKVSLSGYTFGLYTDAACTIPVTTEIDGVQGLDIVATDAVGEGWIDIILDQTGSYTFYVKETATGINNMTYSDRVVKVDIEVTNGTNGKLIAEVTYDTDVNEDGELEFTNIYDPKDTELIIDFVTKELSGRDLVAGEFTFEVQNLDGTIVLTGTNGVDGKVTFDKTLEFDKVGVYSYNIIETSKDGKGVTTDKNIHRIIVTVSDIDGELHADYVLVDMVGDDIVFRNTYVPTKVSYTISGNKTLIGRVLLNDEFTFVMTDEANAKTYETKNLADGSFRFNAITYTESGTYSYVVSEKVGGGSDYGIKYDKTEYRVTIVIEDDNEGNLVVSDVTYFVNDDETDSIEFVNTYEPNPTSAQIPGNKNLEGKVLSGDDFEFVLITSDENWIEGEALETVQNAQDGTFRFTAIDFDTAGTYYYIVKEVNGGKTIDGVTYDDAVYRVCIVITDDLRGQLHSEIHVYDQHDIPQERILFVNVYEITGNGTVTLDGEKTFIGRDMTDGEFTFELYETGEEFTISGTAKETTTNTGGTFDFTITYTAEDVGKTFYYVVKEANAGKIVDGIYYSAAEYQITVVVEDNGVGGIKTTKTMKNGEISVSNLAFINECVGDLVITKDVDFIKDGNEITASLDNREEKEYFFTVTIGDDITETFTLKNGESKIFEDIVYGTTYTVTEDTTGAVFTSVITGGTGTIGAATTDVTVTNTYDYRTGENAGFNAIKVDEQTNEPLEGAEFTLYSDEACENAVATTTSDATGKVHFDITEAGTYYLKETKAPEGYYLSDVVHVIKAEIKYVEILEGEHGTYIEERMLITAENLHGVTEDGITLVYYVGNTPVETVEVSVEKKWVVPEGFALPETLEVVLYKDGEVYETIQLSANNNWSYTWTGLSEEFTWTVDEVKVPNGFAKKVESDGSDFTITNTYTETIKNTGDNMMPTFYGITLLLAGMGVVFTAVKLRRKEETA